MAFTTRYAADVEDRESQKYYETRVQEVYDDWLQNKEIHLIDRPTLGVDYKNITTGMVKDFLSTKPQYIKITYTLHWKKTNIKKTQVWANKKKINGKFVLCLYKINCTIMKVQEFRKPKFVLSKSKEGKEPKVMVLPMTGGKGNRKSLMGLLRIESIVQEADYVDENDQEIVCKYFLDIIRDIWKGFHWEPTVEIRLLSKLYKKYLDYKYEVQQFRKIMKARGDVKSTTLGSYPKSNESTPPESPISPTIIGEGGEEGEGSGETGEYTVLDETQASMDDSANLIKDIEDKYKVLRDYRSEVYEQLKILNISPDDPSLRYIEDVPIHLAAYIHALKMGTETVESINEKLDECYMELQQIVKDKGLHNNERTIMDYERLGKRFHDDDEAGKGSKRVRS